MPTKRKGFKITKTTQKEERYIQNQIINFNNQKVPLTQKPKFIYLNHTLKNDKGKIVGGILACMYCWKCVQVEVLWVDEKYRKQGYGTLLLKKVEAEAKKKGGKIIHLDTFDFQAKDFYLKHGYKLFGTLEGCPPKHKRFYLKKHLK